MTSAKDVIKPGKHNIGDENPNDAKSSIPTPYIVKGDGQITIKVVTPEKRDAYLAKNHNINEAKAVIGEETDGPRRMMNWSKPIRAAMTIRIQPRKMTREATRNPIKARIRNRLNRSAPSTWICSTSRS